MAARGRPEGGADFFEAYTKDLTTKNVQRLFTEDARDAYQFFTHHIDEKALQGLPPIKRIARARVSSFSRSRSSSLRRDA